MEAARDPITQKEYPMTTEQATSLKTTLELMFEHIAQQESIMFKRSGRPQWKVDIK